MQVLLNSASSDKIILTHEERESENRTIVHIYINIMYSDPFSLGYCNRSIVGYFQVLYKMDSKQTIHENDPQLNCVEIDHGNYRNASMVCDDRLISEIRNSFKQVLRQISTGNEINRLRKRQLEYNHNYNYNMNHKHRGLALIFNHPFCDISSMKREGTQMDRDRMYETLHSLDFDVQVYDDLKKHEILEKLKKGNIFNNL